MYNKKGFYLLLFMFILSIALVACGGGSDDADSGTDTGDSGSDASSGGEEMTLKFAHEEGQGDVQDLYANKFKELIEEKTDGRIKVDVYTAGTLGTNMDVLQSLQTGAIEIAITSPGFSGDVIPESQIMAIPFLFSDNLEVNKKVFNESEALYGPLAEKYEEKGITPFKFWLEGFMYWTANKEITTPDDMKGVKIRTMPTSLIIKSYELMGANPTPTDSGEIYTMLQTKGIDAQENPLFYIVSSNFLEVQDYLMDSKHHIYTTVTAANQDFFEGLSEEDQQIIRDVVDEVNEWSFDMQDEEAEKALEKAKEEDIEIIELTSEQREAFKELSLPAREEYKKESDAAKEILETLEKEIEEAEAELAE
ncbi:TRAP transporter substrate-binding protein DctP [Pseudogracilibacillus sp. SE30717A]|uniref:TRAP transporter substrate-binding protein DctP n=1 Tax=Pseudogracilibacillus sp. SE30717A TaxID=3098293 RepID=UPI00300DCBE3